MSPRFRPCCENLENFCVTPVVPVVPKLASSWNRAPVEGNQIAHEVKSNRRTTVMIPRIAAPHINLKAIRMP